MTSPLSCRGLSVLIDWEKEGFEIAGTAANGLEAIRFLKNNEVDLILADIRMPAMSGLELLEKLRTEGISDAYFIILSGYSDFEYARKALQYGCMDYILKPVRKTELIAALDKVKAESSLTLRKKEEEALQEKAYFARNLIAIICGKYDQMNLEYVTAKMRTDGGIRYIDIEIDDRNEEGSEYVPPKTEEEKKGNCRGFCTNPVWTFWGEDGWHCIFDVSSNERDYDIGLIYCDYMAQEAGMNEQDYLDSFLGSIQEAIKHPVVMFVGNRDWIICGLSESYRTANIARSFRISMLTG